MIYDSLLERAEVFFATATISAHASALGDSFSSVAGFRQRDVKFLIDLFSNWVESTQSTPTLPVQNTQILRYLNDLTENGYARRITRGARPLYRLTRTGLIELLTRLTHRNYSAEPRRFFFLCYFIKNYRNRIETLVKAEGRDFPYALKIELEALFDYKVLIKRELEGIDRELKKLTVRMEDACKTSEYMKKAMAGKQPLETTVKAIEKLYPYELNSQKPLAELIAFIPEKNRQWELECGNMLRVEELWQPQERLLRNYAEELRRMLRQ